MRTRPFFLIAAALAVVAGSWLARGSEPASEPVSPASGLRSPSAASSLDEVDRLIDEFSTRYIDFGGVTNGTTLGRLYLVRGRITGSVADYDAADQALESTLRDAPQSSDTKLFLGYARNGLHRFGDASVLAAEILAVEPQRFDALALFGDTALSLGDYDLARTSVVGARGGASRSTRGSHPPGTIGQDRWRPGAGARHCIPSHRIG